MCTNYLYYTFYYLVLFYYLLFIQFYLQTKKAKRIKNDSSLQMLITNRTVRKRRLSRVVNWYLNSMLLYFSIYLYLRNVEIKYYRNCKICKCLLFRNKLRNRIRFVNKSQVQLIDSKLNWFNFDWLNQNSSCIFLYIINPVHHIN